MSGQRYTYEEVEAALCAWEHILEQIRGPRQLPNTKWHDRCEQIGTASLRMWCLDQAKTIDKAYEIAVANGYDAPFDWEFVPEFMEKAYDDGLALRKDWKDWAVEIAIERML